MGVSAEVMVLRKAGTSSSCPCIRRRPGGDEAVGLSGAYPEMESAITVEQVYRPDLANESVYREELGVARTKRPEPRPERKGEDEPCP